MGETKKIVIEHFPVEKLPEELKRGLEDGQLVRVTVESVEGRNDASSAGAGSWPLSSFLGIAPGLYASPQDVVAHIRSLRDESDR